jgi:RimJ/RimL family protein N-acetyltransferase
MPSKLKLMEMQAKALFTHDSDNFIRNINDLSGAPAPRFFYGRTPEGNVLRFRYDLPQEVIKKLTELVSTEPSCCDLPRSTVVFEEIKEVLQEHKEIQYIYEGPAYKLIGGINLSADVIKITKDKVALLENSFDYMSSELQFWVPCYAKLVDGKAVSICFSSRIAVESHEAGVETLPDFRGKGYAAEVVAAWAADIYKMNRIPTYSASWDNAASQAVARKLKCEFYGVDLSIY